MKSKYFSVFAYKTGGLVRSSESSELRGGGLFLWDSLDTFWGFCTVSPGPFEGKAESAFRGLRSASVLRKPVILQKSNGSIPQWTVPL